MYKLKTNNATEQRVQTLTKQNIDASELMMTHEGRTQIGYCYLDQSVDTTVISFGNTPNRAQRRGC